MSDKADKKQIVELTFGLNVEDIQPVVLKALGMTKSKLIEWRETMASHGYQGRVEETQSFIDMLVKAEKEENQQRDF